MASQHTSLASKQWDLRRQFCGRDAGVGGDISRGAAAEAITAARKVLFVPMLMGRCFPVMVGVPFRARLGVSGAQMERGMGIAACKRERQQHDQAA